MQDLPNCNHMPDHQKPLSATTKVLGYGGLIPFVCLSAAAILKIDLNVVGIESNAQALLNYAAVIVSFLGAVHWGVALSRDEPCVANFLYGVIPSLLAWVLLIIPVKPALFAMAVIVVFAYVVDRSLLFDLLRYQYAAMRLHLTVIVATCLILAAAFV